MSSPNSDAGFDGLWKNMRRLELFSTDLCVPLLTLATIGPTYAFRHKVINCTITCSKELGDKKDPRSILNLAI